MTGFPLRRVVPWPGAVRQRTAFQLKGFQGMTIREIAQIMDSAEGTVKSHLFRATRFLSEALSDWADPEGRS